LLAHQLRGEPLLVMAAYREAEGRHQPEVGALLARLAREAEVLPLARPSPEAVAQWVRDAGAGEAEDWYRLSEGHPLYLVEGLRLGRSPGPSGLEGLLDEHLARLPADARPVLEAAAVLGRELSVADLAATAEQPLDPVQAALGEHWGTQHADSGHLAGSSLRGEVPLTRAKDWAAARTWSQAA
jgi:hypothetical protein